LTDALGEVAYSARYTPWGDTLETYGTGNFAFGYFGGLMDAATGLLYVGDGQYYDPSTGRFLTRNARPNQANPYVPWDPTGAIIGPLGLLAVFLGRRKKKSKYDILLFVLAFAVVTGVALSACGGGGGNDPGDGGNSNPPTSPPPSETPHPPTDAPPPTPTQPPPAPVNTPEPECIYPQPGNKPVPNDAKHRSYGIGVRFYRLFDETPGGWWDRYRDPDAGLWPILITMAFHWETYALGHNSLYMAAMQEAFSRKLWGSYKDYGRDGWAYYLGGREPIRNSVAVLEAYKGNWVALDAKLQDTYKMSSSVAGNTYDSYGKTIWCSSLWRNGYDYNRPWEFGNPTEKSPSDFLKAMQKPLPSCNGHCTDRKSIYFRDAPLNLDNYYINDQNLKIYHYAFVVTPAQQEWHCGGASCVKP
jgi:RHS repeat-associated protein